MDLARLLIVRRDRADAVRDAADVKVLGGLLIVEEAVVASPHPTDKPLAFSKILLLSRTFASVVLPRLLHTLD
jgi:hypothetical protein